MRAFGRSTEPRFMWDKDRDARLAELWNEGLSCSLIAERFGDCTRDAIIGRVHRLGLKRPPNAKLTAKQISCHAKKPPKTKEERKKARHEWPEDRVERLRVLFHRGWSFQQIAVDLGGGISRNAVLARAFRMGLERSPQLRRQMRAQQAPRPVIVQKPKISAITGGIMHGHAEPVPPVLPPAKANAFRPLPGTLPKPFGEVMVCKWPIDGFDLPMCCGQPRPDDLAYCPTHRAMSGTPPKTTPKQLARSLRWAA